MSNRERFAAPPSWNLTTSKRRFFRTSVPHLSFGGEAATARGLAEDALVLKLSPLLSLARSSASKSGPFLRRQGQPLYSSKYRNDSSPPARAKERERESGRPRRVANAQGLTTSNYVIAEELLTEPVPRSVIQ